MNVWEWVHHARRDLAERGEHRFIEIMEQLSSVALHGEKEELDALFPEALALARKLGNPWYEVFVRHWNLQGQVANHGDVENWLSEAVSLLDFASQEETKDCPQSICAVQDVSIAFSAADGPGYAQDRLDVSRETIGKITPRWDCYVCLSIEEGDALEDMGRYEEALALYDEREKTARAAGLKARRGTREGYDLQRSTVWLALGRWSEAEAAATAVIEVDHDEDRLASARIARAHARLELGKAEEALADLPPIEDLRLSPRSVPAWLNAARRFVEEGQLENDWTLDGRIQPFVTMLAKRGACRDALTVSVARGWLAVDRGRRGTAELCIRDAEALVPRLRAPLDAPETIAELREATEALSRSATAALPENVDELLDAAGPDAEEALDLFAAACERWPDEETPWVARTSALKKLRRDRDALELLRELAERRPDWAESFSFFLHELIGAGQRDEARELAEKALGAGGGDEMREMAHWALARLARLDRKYEDEIAHLDGVLATSPQAWNARCAKAKALQLADRLDEAVEVWDALCAEDPDDGPHHWDRMVAATLAGRWDRVRESAAAVGMEIDGDEGPIDERWGWCDVRFDETGTDGRPLTLAAVRTGPVTALILQADRVGDDTHHRDLVVFDASPLNEAPKDEEERERHVWMYPAVRVLEPGNRRVFVIDGWYPKPEQIDRVHEALDEIDGSIWFVAGSSYELEDPDTGELRRGLYARVSIPKDRELAELDGCLESLSQELEIPILRPALLQAMGETERAKSQTEDAARLGIALD